MPGSFKFPVYSVAERIADASIHVVGLILAVIGVTWLLVVAWHSHGVGAPSLTTYGIGLLGMLGASAAYNLCPAGRVKEGLRRLDHGMIFVMIAGSYTPFALNALAEHGGPWLLGVVWGVALAGVGLKLAQPRRWERVGLALYLGLGWTVLMFIGPLIRELSVTALLLLLIGGGLYTLGTAFHMANRLRFHNAIWHGFVIAAAACHFAAISMEFA